MLTPHHASDDEAAPTVAAEDALSNLAAARGGAVPPRRCEVCERNELAHLRAEHRRLEREIAEINRQLAAKQSVATAAGDLNPIERHRHDAQRLESLGVLAGGLAHQFNNLLTIITGHVGLAASEAVPGTMMAHSLEEIRMASQRAAALCRQMLDAAGHSFASRREIDVSTLVHEAIALAGVDEPGRCELQYEPASLPLPHVRGVAAQLQQAIAALLLNGFEAVGAGSGRVRLVLHDLPLDPRQAALLSTPVRAGHYVCIEVQDEGGGIAIEVLGRIFEPFFSTKGLGRGLGLAVAAGIARAHGGGIGVEPRAGVGTIFRLYLPVFESAPVAN